MAPQLQAAPLLPSQCPVPLLPSKPPQVQAQDPGNRGLDLGLLGSWLMCASWNPEQGTVDLGQAEVMTRAVERTGQEPEAWYDGQRLPWAGHFACPKGVSATAGDLNSTPTETPGSNQTVDLSATGKQASGANCPSSREGNCHTGHSGLAEGLGRQGPSGRLSGEQRALTSLSELPGSRHSKALPYLEISLEKLHTNGTLLA